MADKSRTLLVRFTGDFKDLDQAVDAGQSKMAGLGKALGALGGIAAAALGGAFIGDAINEAREAAKVGAQTEAVLKSTGGAAKVSAGQIGDLATALSNKAGIDDEVIQSGANVLLTFTKVRNEVGAGNNVFDRATESALDMSAALGMDLQSSVTMVGKALNDPIKGISAMSKAGIQFTQVQKDEIKALVAKGDVLGAQKIILGELQTQFGGMAAASADSGQKFTVALGNLKEAIGTALLPIFNALADVATQRLIPGFMVAAEFFQNRFIPALASVRDWIRDRLFPVLVDIWRAVEPVVMPVVRVIQDVAVAAFRRLVDILRSVSDTVTGNTGPAIQNMTQWIRDNEIVVAAVLGALGAWVAKLVLVSTWMGTLRLATLAITAVTWLYNAALAANPITLIILAIGALVGALIYAWNHSDTFRAKVTAMWEGIQAAAKWAWENILKPTFDALVVAFQATAAAAVWLWQNVLKPAFEGIAAVATWLWVNIMKPVFDQLVTLFTETVMPVVTQLWQNVVKPAFEGIAAVASWLWTNVISVVFGWIVDIIQNVVGPTIAWLWTNIVKPNITFIGDIISWLWQNVISIVFGAIGLAIRILADVIVWLYQNIVDPVFTALGKVISWVWDTIIRPVFDALVSALDWIGDAFRKTADWISETWAKIKDAALKPVQFVVDVVYNNGIRKVWNGIASLFGLDELPEVRFADGGQVRGPGGPRDDKIPAWLSNGEYVIPANRVDQYGVGMFESIRAGRFADGGLVGWVKDKFAGVGDGLANFGQHPWVKALMAIPGKAIGGIMSKVEEMFASSAANFTVGAGVERWTPLVVSVLGMLGQSMALVPNVLRRMNQESGGNPNAINNWDSNAAAGIPSKGLMQVIDPTFNAYADQFRPRGIWDPLANIYAGLNYAIHRYPSLQYAMDKPGGYDNGGWLRPGESGVNALRRPEAVLTPVQSEAFVALAQNAARGGATKVEKHYHLTVYTTSSEIDLETQFNRMELMSEG